MVRAGSMQSVIACSDRFLMCTVLSVSRSLSKSITFSKEGRGSNVGGHGTGTV